MMFSNDQFGGPRANQQGTVTGPPLDHIGVLCILRRLPKDAEQCEAVKILLMREVDVLHGSMETES